MGNAVKEDQENQNIQESASEYSFYGSEYYTEQETDKDKEIRDEIVTYLLIKAKKPYDFGIKILRLMLQ